MENKTFKAFIVEENSDKTFSHGIKEAGIDDLPQGEVLIRENYSSLNYKDALSASGNKGVTRQYPHTPGIDAAGIVEHSQAKDFKPDLPINVFPFILRGISLFGIDSQHCPMALRQRLWNNLSTNWKPDNLESLSSKIGLKDMGTSIERILKGQLKGRTLVDLG